MTAAAQTPHPFEQSMNGAWLVGAIEGVLGGLVSGGIGFMHEHTSCKRFELALTRCTTVYQGLAAIYRTVSFVSCFCRVSTWPSRGHFGRGSAPNMLRPKNGQWI